MPHGSSAVRFTLCPCSTKFQQVVLVVGPYVELLLRCRPTRYDSTACCVTSQDIASREAMYREDMINASNSRLDDTERIKRVLTIAFIT